MHTHRHTHRFSCLCSLKKIRNFPLGVKKNRIDKDFRTDWKPCIKLLRTRQFSKDLLNKSLFVVVFSPQTTAQGFQSHLQGTLIDS